LRRPLAHASAALWDNGHPDSNRRSDVDQFPAGPRFLRLVAFAEAMNPRDASLTRRGARGQKRKALHHSARHPVPEACLPEVLQMRSYDSAIRGAVIS